jgi:hypothetical protein
MFPSIAIDTCQHVDFLSRVVLDLAPLSLHHSIFRTDPWSRRHHRKTGNTNIPPPSGLVTRGKNLRMRSFQPDLSVVMRGDYQLAHTTFGWCSLSWFFSHWEGVSMVIVAVVDLYRTFAVPSDPWHSS